VAAARSRPVLVQQGTLKIHEPFIVGQIYGRVRAMFNDRGEPITEAGPATPVEVLGPARCAAGW
jgi:translation initiation factor IF-2